MDAERASADYLEAILAADARGAARVVDGALAAGLDGLAVLDEVIAPALHEVGRRWELGAISVADEHLASAITHRVLVAVYPALAGGEPRSRARVLMAGAEGEEHVLGLRMAADVLEAAGFEVQYAGASLPWEALHGAVRRHRPRLVGLASTFATDRGRLTAAVERLRAAEPGVGILLGGAATRDVADLPGVRVVARARDIVPAAEALLAELPAPAASAA